MAHRTLVTGGAGFIGSHLVDRLLADGDQVTVLDNLTSGRRENLDPRAALVVGDVSDTELLNRLVAGADSVFHLAALVSVQECIADWFGGHQQNLVATMQVMAAAHAAGGAPVVYASSAAIYGDRTGTDCAEGDLPAPISPYGADKLACEHQARSFAVIHGLPSAGLRFFNVFGPRQDPKSPYAGVISRFCANRLNDQPHRVFGDGGQSRDFIYVSDIVEGLVRARDHARQNGGAEVFNLCTGRATTLLELARVIDQVSGRAPLPIDHAEARAGDIRASLGRPDKAREAMGFVATTSLEDGLRQLWASLAD